MPEQEEKVSILFVCMGNICRSPTAEGVFRKLVSDAGLEDRIHVDSAGTHAYHTGESPDRRGMEAADRRGFSLKGIRARRVVETDFAAFDYIIAMDEDNLAKLRESADVDHHGKLRLFLEFAAASTLTEVPDPYYGGLAGFERVLDLVEDAAQGLLAEIRRDL
jgi:protein-tyrosine phosphatase